MRRAPGSASRRFEREANARRKLGDRRLGNADRATTRQSRPKLRYSRMPTTPSPKLHGVAMIALATLAACGPRTAPTTPAPVRAPSRAPSGISVIPRPASLTASGGAAFALQDSTWVVTDASGDAEVTRT